jgi:trehalose synthase
LIPVWPGATIALPKPSHDLVPAPINVPLVPQSLERYREILGGRFGFISEQAEKARELFGERVLWQVNSTHLGGGVAEMLRSFLPYAIEAGVDTRWLVLSGDPGFFEATKRIHNKLHGHPGDGGTLGSLERASFDRVSDESADGLLDLVRPGDVVFLHDPQTAGLVERLRDRGALTLWRCHVGIDRPNEHVEEAVEFLIPMVSPAHGYVFSRGAYAWQGLDSSRTYLMAPAIDAFSPKNQELDPETVLGILQTVGLAEGEAPSPPSFLRSDGTPGTVERVGEVLQEYPVPPNATLVTQVSRWDVLKDHEGLLACFRDYLADTEAHLALVGPSSGAVADDPEGPAVQERIGAAWHELPPEVRARIHVVSLPMDDFDENGVMVNAIQRRSDVIVQKSLAEGFGLTVSEAMWKGVPVVASAVGGILDQVVDGETGFLISDPTDLEAFGSAIRELIEDPEMALRMGAAARERVAEEFLAASRIAEYVNVVGLLGAAAAGDPSR